MAVDRAVIGGEQNRHARRSASRSASHSGERSNQVRVRLRSAERVAGHFVEGGVLGPSVGELVDEVEYQRSHALLRQMGGQALEQTFAVGGREHFLVVDGDGPARELAHAARSAARLRER